MTSESTVDLLGVSAAPGLACDDPAALLARWRPGLGTWFSGPRGGLLADGALQRLDDPDDVPALLEEVAATGPGPALVVGALPFDPADPAALVVPREVTWSPALGRAVDAPGRGGPSPCWVSRSVPDPAGYEAMVAEALRRMGTGDLEKVVLARVLELEADAPVDQATMLRGLAARDPSGYVFAVDLPAPAGGPPRTLLGASPELLISRRDGEVIANPLAGSAPRRRDPADDEATGAALLASAKDRHEHALVVTDVAAALGGVCDDLAVPDGALADPHRRDVAPVDDDPRALAAARPSTWRGHCTRRPPSAGCPAPPRAGRSPSSSRSTAASTPAWSAGPTCPGTASGSSPCAAARSVTRPPGSTRAPGWSRPRCRRPNWRRRRRSWRRCSRRCDATLGTVDWAEIRGSRTLHEDEALLVLDKPAGWSVMGERHDTDLVRLAADDGEKLWPAHRIDKVTSGVVLFAKDLAHHGDLTRQFNARTVEKTYLAVTATTGLPERGRIELPLSVGRKNRVRIAAPREAIAYDDGDAWTVPDDAVLSGVSVYPSTTTFERLGEADGRTLLAVHPETGRRHQNPGAPRLDRPRARRRPALRQARHRPAPGCTPTGSRSTPPTGAGSRSPPSRGRTSARWVPSAREH